MTAPPEPDWAATYRASLYAFEDAGAWRRFALDAERGGLDGLRASVCLVTAWNPASREMPAAWNRAANARLAADLAARAVPHAPAFGASLPGVEPAWREDGFALFGLEPETARAWGARYGQRAVVWLDAREARLLFCDGAPDAACGARELANPPA